MTTARHLLLIEDNPGDAELFKQALAEAGCDAHLHTVETVNDALAFLGQSDDDSGEPRPDLIVLDLNLPGVCGAVGLSLIKATEDWRDIPVLVLTSSTRAVEREECQRLGAIDYWVKPADWDTYLRFGEDLAYLLPQWTTRAPNAGGTSQTQSIKRPPASTESLPANPHRDHSQPSG